MQIYLHFLSLCAVISHTHHHLWMWHFKQILPHEPVAFKETSLTTTKWDLSSFSSPWSMLTNVPAEALSCQKVHILYLNIDCAFYIIFIVMLLLLFFFFTLLLNIIAVVLTLILLLQHLMTFPACISVLDTNHYCYQWKILFQQNANPCDTLVNTVCMLLSLIRILYCPLHAPAFGWNWVSLMPKYAMKTAAIFID